MRNNAMNVKCEAFFFYTDWNLGAIKFEYGVFQQILK